MICLLLAGVLFFQHPEPIEMPRAEAFLVREKAGDATNERETAGRMFLEDRFVKSDLWFAHALLGRWSDRDARVFSLFRLDRLPPAVDADETVTRTAFEAEAVSLDRKRHPLRPLVDLLSPVDLAEKSRPIRQVPHGFAEVEFWQHPTNLSAIVCSFRLDKAAFPLLATWELAAGDDFYAFLDLFEKQFLDSVRKRGGLPDAVRAAIVDSGSAPKRGSSGKRSPDSGGENRERALLRRDVRANVALYPNWHCTEGDDFEVIDDLPARSFAISLTNDLRRLRTRFAEVLPTGLDGSNVLSVARIYANREEYLMSIDSEMAWTAAYWSPQRRELVAHLPNSGSAADLLKTIRHESFHQYLSYALSMISASPWLNEGYAQYFEDGGAGGAFDEPFPPEGMDWPQLAAILPGILGMDYQQFYDGSDAARHLKYRLAWSIAVFLEEGAPLVRFQPFKDIKRDYVAALFRTRDMHKATAAAFKSEDFLKKFVREWKKFWMGR